MLLFGLLFQEQVKEDTTVLSFGLETPSISNYIWLIRKVLQIVLSLLLSFVNNAIFGILKGRVSPQESFFFTKGALLIPKPIVQILTKNFHPKNLDLSCHQKLKLSPGTNLVIETRHLQTNLVTTIRHPEQILSRKTVTRNKYCHKILTPKTNLANKNWFLEQTWSPKLRKSG